MRGTDRWDDRSFVPGLVSVVIPTYRHADLVAETLESVLAQSYASIEIVVINDGSPDRTAEVLRPYRDRALIRYFEQPNRGQAGARNRGIGEARGEFIKLRDDDDLLPAAAITTQVAALRARPGAVLAYGSLALLRPDGSTWEDPSARYPDGDVRTDFLDTNWIVSPGQALMRTEAIRSIGGLDEAIWGCDDWDLYLRLANTGAFAFVKGVALRYRVHEASASRTHAARLARNYLRVMYKNGLRNPRRVARQLRLIEPVLAPRLAAAGRAAAAECRTRDATDALALYLLFRSALVMMIVTHPERMIGRLQELGRSLFRSGAVERLPREPTG